jgi:hypothetical protein
MNVEIHTLAWPNTDAKLVQAHTDVCKHLGIDVAYTLQRLPHGLWMNEIMAQSKSDVVGFLDIDCIPTNKLIVEQSIDYCAQNKSFVGIAQASNHIKPCSHIFAAPAFFFIWRETWEALQRPTFSEVLDIADVAENVSYAAEMEGVRYKTLYPTHYTKTPDEGPWNLHTYGVYGIGTHFEGGVYHLYQARMNNNVELFVDTAKQIMDGTFTTDNMKACREV